MKTKSAVQTILISTCVGILLAPSLLYAVDAPPAPPWVAPVPENVRWTLTVTDDSGSNNKETAQQVSNVKATRKLQQISVIKTGTTKQDIFSYNDGTKEERWYVDKFTLEPESSDKSAIDLLDFSESGFQELGSALYSTGFTGVHWIKGSYYDKIVTYQNLACYHYIFPAEPGTEAWISIKDKMPVAYRMDGILYVYSFGDTPSSPLILPPAYATVYKNYQELQQRRGQLEKAFGPH